VEFLVALHNGKALQDVCILKRPTVLQIVSFSWANVRMMHQLVNLSTLCCTLPEASIVFRGRGLESSSSAMHRKRFLFGRRGRFAWRE